jgi:hypothetical protein
MGFAFSHTLILLLYFIIANTSSHLLRLFALLLIPKKQEKSKISPFYIRETKISKFSQ